MSWRSVELQEIRVLLALDEERHFGRAAERLSLTQSRVSQSLRGLERKLGAQLFDRTSRRVEVTDTGRLVIDDVGRAYAELLRALQRSSTHASGVSGTLRIGIYSPLSTGPHMTRIVQAFGAANPACDVVFVDTGLTTDPVRPLLAGDVDLLATRIPLDHPDVTVGPVLSREPRVLLVARTDELATRAAIDYDEIGERPVSDLPAFPRVLMDAYIPPVTPRGRTLRRITSSTTEQAMMRVALGQQVHPTVVSWTDYHSHPDVVAVPIRDLPNSETALVYSHAVQIPRVTAFVTAAVDVLATTDLV